MLIIHWARTTLCASAPVEPSQLWPEPGVAGVVLV